MKKNKSKKIRSKKVQLKEVQSKEIQSKEVQSKEIQSKEIQSKEIQERIKLIIFNGIKFTAFTTIFLILTYYIGNELNNVAPPLNPYAPFKWKEFYELKKNSLDVVYLGSSHAYRGFEPNIIDKELKINSFNMGTPLQKPVESYYILKELLRTQKPKAIVFDTFWNVFNDEKYFGTKTCNYDLMRFGSPKLGFLLNVFDKDQLLPATLYAVRYHDLRDKYIDLKDKYGWMSDSKTYKYKLIKPKTYLGKGFVKSSISLDKWRIKAIAAKPPEKKLKEFEWNATQWNYFIKIIELCKKEKIKLMLVTIPSCPTRIKVIDKYEYPYKPISDKIEKVARENGLTYVDYNLVNKAKGFLKDSDFSDDNHLNYVGVEKLSKLLIPDMKKALFRKFQKIH